MKDSILPYLIRRCITYLLITSFSFTLPYSVSIAQTKVPVAPLITASAGKDCFKSLDAKDMENLGSILYIRERTASSLTPVSNDYDAQRKAIDANFSGIKREAAYALLTSAIATSNEALLKQVMNQALARGQMQLNDNDKKQISHLIEQGFQNGVDLVSMLNLRTASMSQAAEILKSKGAKISANGEWDFSADFNFY
jgi:ribulose bisphosphate carboxylase small subunit